ncbi:MAG: nuclear transport factor 2 family protein [Candidatus Latescibacterota bacterium]|nr:MAG: nuclear transport factor 2 family protein [Candidatus Latescibacterota bacterium]
MKWFDRKFACDLPAWMYPNVVERLRGTPARIEDRILGISGDILIKRDGSNWSIQEHIGHLWLVEELWVKRLDDFENGKTTLTPADLENRRSHEANFNEGRVGDLLSSFRAERTGIVGRLDAYDEGFVLRTANHPRLDTPMRVVDLAFFIAEHDDHHLALITDLIHKFAGEAKLTDVEVVERFVDAINSHDVDRILALTTDDHVLVDPGSHVVQGGEKLRRAWEGYFAMFPDYRISVTDIVRGSTNIGVFGAAGGTYAVDGELPSENSWTIPAAWLANVRDQKVSRWQVYADNEPVRQILDRRHDR